MKQIDINGMKENNVLIDADNHVNQEPSGCKNLSAIGHDVSKESALDADGYPKKKQTIAVFKNSHIKVIGPYPSLSSHSPTHSTNSSSSGGYQRRLARGSISPNSKLKANSYTVLQNNENQAPLSSSHTTSTSEGNVNGKISASSQDSERVQSPHLNKNVSPYRRKLIWNHTQRNVSPRKYVEELEKTLAEMRKDMMMQEKTIARATSEINPNMDSISLSLQARKERKSIEEQALMMENRLHRLKLIEREYEKRIEQARKQAEMIRNNRERHEQEQQKKEEYCQKKQQQLRDEKLRNAKIAEERRNNIVKQRQMVALQNKQKVEGMRSELAKLKKQFKEEEKKSREKKVSQKNMIEQSKQQAKKQRLEELVERVNRTRSEHVREMSYQQELKELLQSKTECIEEEEKRMLERLRQKEMEQELALQELKQAVFYES